LEEQRQTLEAQHEAFDFKSWMEERNKEDARMAGIGVSEQPEQEVEPAGGA